MKYDLIMAFSHVDVLLLWSFVLNVKFCGSVVLTLNVFCILKIAVMRV